MLNKSTLPIFNDIQRDKDLTISTHTLSNFGYTLIITKTPSKFWLHLVTQSLKGYARTLVKEIKSSRFALDSTIL